MISLIASLLNLVHPSFQPLFIPTVLISAKESARRRPHGHTFLIIHVNAHCVFPPPLAHPPPLPLHITPCTVAFGIQDSATNSISRTSQRAGIVDSAAEMIRLTEPESVDTGWEDDGTYQCGISTADTT